MRACPGRQHSHNMQLSLICFCMPDRFQESRILKKSTIIDTLAYFYHILLHDPAGADIHMARLAISGLAVGQTDIFAGSMQSSVRIFFDQIIQHWRFSKRYSIPFVWFRNTPAVKDDQDHREIIIHKNLKCKYQNPFCHLERTREISSNALTEISHSLSLIRNDNIFYIFSL